MIPKDNQIKELINQIVTLLHPLRIILFGSAARGDMGTHSDIDVLVVMPEGVHRRRTAQAVYRHVRNMKIPFDVLVATPADLDQHRDNRGLIYHTILAEGKEVYAC